MTELQPATATLAEEGRPVTADGALGVIMLFASGNNGDTQWFDYRPGFQSPVLRVEWDHDTMSAVLPADTAELLINRGYARLMTSAEAHDYNGRVGAGGGEGGSEASSPSSSLDPPAEPPAEPPAPTRKGKRS